MKLGVIALSFGLPFLVALLGVGPIALLGSCDNVTTCDAKGFIVGPIILIAVLITGFVAGRVSSSSTTGLLAVFAAVGLVVGVITFGGLWFGASDGSAWLFLTGVAFALMLPGLLIGRSMREAGVLDKLDAERATGVISPEEYARRMALHGHAFHDQAPPGHRCGRCGKHLSPAWHGKCLHCGASYSDYPPVPTTPVPEQ